MTVPLPSSGSGSWYPWASQLHDRLLALRASVFGAAANDEVPVFAEELTAANNNLASNDYLLGGGFTTVVDNYSMLSFPSGGIQRVTVPVAGRWDIEWSWWATLSASTAMAAKVCKNVPVTGVTATQAAVGYSILSASQPPGAEPGCSIRQTVMLAAGDTLAFGLWAGATFSLPVLSYGGVRTNVVVRWLGPK